MTVTQDDDERRIDEAIAKLGEHFDAVQVFATRYEGEDRTITASKGSGNWYARYGQVRSWLVKNDERERQEVRES